MMVFVMTCITILDDTKLMILSSSPTSWTREEHARYASWLADGLLAGGHGLSSFLVSHE
jgi:hypothetical protein